MLKNRLISGVLMTIGFAAFVLLDSWLDGSLTKISTDDKKIQATGLFILVCIVITAAFFELSGLAEKSNLQLLLPVSIPACIMLAGCWFWSQALTITVSKFVLLLLALSFLALIIYQYKKNGFTGLLENCGAALFAIIYLGLLTSFILAIRIEFGVLYLLMFIFVVKYADVGAYFTGVLFGRHKFSPVISPGKTWEGLIGAIIFATIVACAFAAVFHIISIKGALVFGPLFAFIGQMGDLAESAIKRQAAQKDSAGTIPGFGGILDVIDSLLVSAVFAYLFFFCR